MRVLFISGFPFPNGTKSNLFNLRAACALADEVQIEVLTYRSWRPGRRLYTREIVNGIRVHYFSVPHHPSPGNRFFLWNLRIVERVILFAIRRLLTNFDLIHSVSLVPNGILGGWISRRFGIPHVSQLIGSDVVSWLPLVHKYEKHLRIERLVDGIGCNSHATLEEYRRRVSEPNESRVIYRGVSLTEFDCTSVIHKPTVDFLYLGGMPKYVSIETGNNTKGGISVMQAWKMFESELLQHNVRLHFGGPIADLDRFDLWQRSLTSRDSVVFLGHVAAEQLPSLYAQMDVVLVPSLQEGLPNVAVEASACGKCVIGSNVGGIPEIVRNNLTGLLVPPGDVIALGNAMVKLAKDPGLMSQLGSAARRHVVENFDCRNFARKYIEFYQSVLSNEGHL